MNQQAHSHFPFVELPKDSPAIKMLSLWFGLFVFFFSPDVVHAEFLDRLELIQHLRQSHFQKLEQMFNRQERLYQAKKIPEEHVETAYFAFANSAADLEEKLNEWVDRNEMNGTALFARGIYYWNMGWVARGGGYMSKTPNQRVSTMKDFFSLSWKDLKLATQYKSASGLPYRFLISIGRNFGDSEGIAQLFHQGLQADPRSFAVRWSFLDSLVPWWSGLSLENSLQDTEQFLKEYVIPFIDETPELKNLLSYPDYLQAEWLKRQNRKEEALPFYQQALTKGGYFWITFQYGRMLSNLSHHEEALRMIDHALRKHPQVPSVLDEKSKILARLNRHEEALQVQMEALQFDELDPDKLLYFARRLRQQHRVEEAEAVLLKGLIYGSQAHFVLLELGALYLQDELNPSKATPYLKKAVELRPDRSWSWLLYASTLSAMHDCKAVEAVQHYLTRCQVSGSCDPGNIEWAEKTSQLLIWKNGCWREHPTLKLLGRLVKWLPAL